MKQTVSRLGRALVYSAPAFILILLAAYRAGPALRPACAGPAPYGARAGRPGALPSGRGLRQAPAGGRAGNPFELIILNGLIVDGTGRAAYRADLGIRNGRIERIGSLSGAAAPAKINAQGLVVAPGFIDAHTHIEEQIKPARQRLAADNFVQQGVTTVITGNCGRSAPDVAVLFGKLERLKLGVNVATLIGHNTIRQEVCGAREKPSSQQLARMESLVKAALDAGAVGFSTGLGYPPGLFAGEDEVVALVRVAARENAVYATHLRDEGAGQPAALEEAVRTAQRAGAAKLHISHFKAAGRSQWGTAQARLDWVRQALLSPPCGEASAGKPSSAGGQAVGSRLQFTADMYPYTSLSSTLDYLVPAEALRWLGNPAPSRRARGSALHPAGQETAATRNRNFQRAVEATLEKLHRDGWQDYSQVRVAFSGQHKDWVGRTISEIVTAQRGGTAASPRTVGYVASPRDQAAWVLRNLRGNIQIIAEVLSEQDVRQLIRAPEMCFGSDSSIHYRGLGRPHPRGAGTFPRVFAEYVRDLKFVPLEEAIRRATDLPARIFDLPARGLIREGYWADLVLFDPARIQDRSTADDPWKPPDGIPFVIENGLLVVRDGKLTGLLPGRPVRRAVGRGQLTGNRK